MWPARADVRLDSTASRRKGPTLLFVGVRAQQDPPRKGVSMSIARTIADAVSCVTRLVPDLLRAISVGTRR